MVGRRRPVGWATVAALVVLATVVAMGDPSGATAPPSGAPATTGCPVPAPEGAPSMPVRGSAAVDALGDDGLAAVAAGSGRTADELRDDLLADPTLEVDRCGLLRVADTFGGGGAPTSGPSAGAGGEPTANGPYPSEQTFFLHSRPGASRVLYLDFDGERIAATNAWAQDYNGGAAFDAVPYDTDGNPAVFSAAERDVVQAVWQRVSEDYRPFGIDVTTQDPGAAAIARSGLADQSYGMRALITNDTVVGANCGCAGIAYLDIFNRTYNGTFFAELENYLPAWAFAESSYSAHDLAEIVSHEVGHTFGLEHDSTASDEYYPGHGPWGPIMGVSAGHPISQFSKGEYAGATNLQDDLAVIATGAPVVADEAGGSIATAAVLPAGPTPSASGTITSGADKDLYRFTATGVTTITVQGAPVGGNLDIRADLLTTAGATLASDDPTATAVSSSTASGLGASITRTLAAGDYVVQIDGVGMGNPLNTGYSDYGSVGAYQMSITTDTTAATVPSAPASPTAVAGDAQATVTWTAPAANGSPIDSYVVTPYRAGVAQPAITLASTATTTTVTGLTNGTSYTFTVRAHNGVGTGPASPASNAVVPAAVAARFHPLVPGRVLDSRPGTSNIGDFSTPWTAGAAGARDVQIGGRVGVPTGAEAVVLNVTVVNPTAGSFLQLWPTGAPQPTYGSSLNFTPGQIVPNAVTVKLGTGGKVRVFNAVGTTDVVIDVAGYYDDGAGGAGFTSLTPARVLDSRPGTINVGPFSTPWSAGTAGIRDVQIGGLAGVPAGAEAVVLNVTVVNPTAGSFLQLWPTGSAQPTYGSSLNFNPGQIVPNQVTVKLGTGGKVRVFNAVGTVDVIVDVAGYYLTGSGRDFYAVVPGRVLDSRPGATNIGPFSTPWSAGTAGIRDVPVGGLAGVPADADGVVMNVTAVSPTAATFVQLWPLGAAQPTLGSNLNADAGQIVPNAVTVKLGTGGKVRVFNAAGRLDLVADVAGYFA